MDMADKLVVSIPDFLPKGGRGCLYRKLLWVTACWNIDSLNNFWSKQTSYAVAWEVHCLQCMQNTSFRERVAFCWAEHFQLECPFVQQAAPYLLMEVTHFGAFGQETVLVRVWFKRNWGEKLPCLACPCSSRGTHSHGGCVGGVSSHECHMTFVLHAQVKSNLVTPRNGGHLIAAIQDFIRGMA